MVDTSTLITALYLVIMFAISIWNAYASGYNIGMVRKNNVEGFQKWASYSGLALAFVGITYLMAMVISIAGYYFGYVDINTVNYALSFDFLVFGLMIIGFGLMVTIQSIMIAAQKKSIWSIFGALYNCVAIVFDVYIYVTGFQSAASVLKSGNQRSQTNTLVIVLAAALIGFLVTRTVYQIGLNKAMGITTQPNQPGMRNRNVRFQ